VKYLPLALVLLLSGCSIPVGKGPTIPVTQTNAPPKLSASVLSMLTPPLVVVPPHAYPVYSFQLRPQGQTNCDLLSLLYTNSTGAASVTIGYSFATNSDWPCTNPPTGPSSNVLAWALQPYALTNTVQMGSNTTATIQFKLTNVVVTATASGPLSYASTPKGPWTVTTNRTVSVTNPITQLYWRGTNAVETRRMQ